MPSLVNKTIVRDLAESIKGVDSFFVTGYQGLSAESLRTLRQRLGQKSARLAVVRNSLVSRVFKDSSMGALTGFFEGPTAITFVKEGPEIVSKILVDCAREQGAFKIRGAYVRGEVWDLATVQRVAGLPSREELIARAIGQIQAPVSGLVEVFSGMLSRLVGALSRLEEERASEL